MGDFTLQRAFDEVLSAGQDGKEHLIALDLEQQCTFRQSGTEQCVKIEKDELESKFIKGGIVVHNHPILTALSLEDIAMASQQDMTVYAVCADGSKYWSKGFTQPVELLELLGPGAEALVHMELTLAAEAFKGEKDLPDNLLGRLKSHVVNLHCRQLKLLDYHFELGAETKAEVGLFLNLLNKHGMKKVAAVIESEGEKSYV
jgi:hypothetical protein